MKVEFTKDMLKEAFLNNKRKRNFMLFKVYESIFTYDHTAEFIAAFISKDLGIPISKSTIDMTRIRVAKKIKSAKIAPKKVKTKSNKLNTTVKNKKEEIVQKEENIGSSASEINPPIPTENKTILENVEAVNSGFEKTTWKEFQRQDTSDLGF
ncbi:MAG: hypothetical protein MUF58_02930 [Arcicella sp.]|jgi:predicted DNA-binding protein YlxM (UPF0122 family)|nr:hypothetical protein [Arcicella sp.]